MPKPDWQQEVKLCDLYLKYDERNCEYDVFKGVKLTRTFPPNYQSVNMMNKKKEKINKSWNYTIMLYKCKDIGDGVHAQNNVDQV